jgi:signal transduction histidine kinase
MFRWLLTWIDLWLITNLAIKFIGSHAVVLYTLRGAFFTSMVMVYYLLKFSIRFPNELEIKNRWLKPAVGISAGLIGILSLTSLLVADYARDGAIVLAQYNRGYYAYLAYILGMFALIMFFLAKQYQISSVVKKQQTKLLFAGFLASMIIISTVDLIIPLVFGNNTPANFGPFGIIFLVVCSFWALTRHHLFDVKVLLSELWAILLIVMIFVWLLMHFSMGNLAVFLIIISICVLFIKSVLSEAAKEEKLEQANQQLEDDKKKLVEVDKLKDDFISMASHELNTPISAIKGYLSMVLVERLGGEIPEKARGYLETVFQSAQRLSGMVNDLLNVSRIESGRIHLVWERKPIEAVILQAITEVASKAREAHHTLTFEEPKQQLPLTWFDGNRITEVLINLLGNAIKYTPSGGKITVNVGYDTHNIIVSVEDNGKGIPKDKVDRVFGKFSQVDVAKDEHKGTGLGMYISKKFVELHNGTIWFNSDGEGKGTTFNFSIPIKTNKPFDPHDGEGNILSEGRC